VYLEKPSISYDLGNFSIDHSESFSMENAQHSVTYMVVLGICEKEQEDVQPYIFSSSSKTLPGLRTPCIEL
jgi:hypothetical protein